MTQRLMALEPASRSDEQAESLVEPIANLRHGHRLHARRGQLDGQWYAVQTAADLCDRLAVVSMR